MQRGVGGMQAQADLQLHRVVEAQQVDGAVVVVVVDLAAIEHDQIDPAVLLDALSRRSSCMAHSCGP
jgi:hypothetical protein